MTALPEVPQVRLLFIRPPNRKANLQNKKFALETCRSQRPLEMVIR